MRKLAHELQQRNQAIGDILRTAREKVRLPVNRCAALIGTSRRRYLAMEAGEAMIGIAEMEILMSTLDIPPNTIWPETSITDATQPVLIQARPGDNIQIVVAVQR